MNSLSRLDPRMPSVVQRQRGAVAAAAARNNLTESGGGGGGAAAELFGWQCQSVSLWLESVT